MKLRLTTWAVPMHPTMLRGAISSSSLIGLAAAGRFTVAHAPPDEHDRVV